MKIGFLTERMLLGFGADLVIHKTAKELTDSGFDVTVFCIRNDGTYQNEKYKVVEISCPMYENPLKTERNAIKALKRLNYEDIDLWIVETYPFFAASRVLKKPVIIVDHGVVSTSGFSWYKKICFSYIKFAQEHWYFPKAEKIVCISRYVRSITPKRLRAKQEIVYNGADNYPAGIDQGKLKKFKLKHGISKGDFVLLYVGRLNHEKQPYKGTKELVEIYKSLKKEHKNIKLIMAGFGSKEDYKELKKNKVIPLICAPEDTMPILFSLADVYVSASKWEGFNLPLIEAGWFGTPAVAYRIGPHKEVLRDDAGFLVESKSEFKEKIELLYRDVALKNKLAEGARKNAKRFNWKRAGERYKKIILEIAEKHRASANEYEEGLVDVIVLNFNGKRYLKNLFDSLKKQTYKKIKVTVVDNGSSDGSAQFIKQDFPWVNLIESSKNLFFCRGNNLAVSRTKGEYIFFLNNDTIIEENAIKEAVDLVERKGKRNIAAVATKMLFLKNKNLIDSVGTVLTSSGAPFNRGIGQIDIGQYDKEEEVFGACFGAVLVRRNIYEKAVGPLDNSYFGYFEDVDWCLRSKLLGYKIYFCPKAVVYHDHSGTSKKQSYDWKYYLIHRNLIRTIIKNFEPKRAVLKTLWKIIGLTRQFFNGEDATGKSTIPKIFLNTLCFLPVLLVKRRRVQKQRCVSDYECVKFQAGEMPAFDPVKYEPILNLDTAFFMFNRLDSVKRFRNKEVSEIVAKINYLRERQAVMGKLQWRSAVQGLIASMEKYLGKHYTDNLAANVLNPKRLRGGRLKN